MRYLPLLALLGGCTQSIDTIRTEQLAPRASIEGRTFDGFVGCIGTAVAGKYDMNFTPTVEGGSYVYSTYGMAGGSSILIDVYRSNPPRAEIRFTGGPWLGQDDDVVRRVRGCRSA